MKLKFVTVEYLDKLHEQVSKICSSAGNKEENWLSLAFKDALFDGFINYNPVPETKPYPRTKPRSEYSVKQN